MDVALVGSVAMWVALAMALSAAMVLASPSLLRRTFGKAPRPSLPDLQQGPESCSSLSAHALTAVAALLTLAVASLAWGLVTGDYRLVYVAEASSRSASWPYRLASLWGGMAGSLLFWTWLLALVTMVAQRSVRRPRPDLVASVGATLAPVTAAFLAIGLAWADPFDRLAVPAIDGAGLAPILEHPAMLYHPPLLYLGLVSCAVPFAVAVAGLLARRSGGDPGTDSGGESGSDMAWLVLIRRWAGIAWLLLTVGMLAGAHWAYVELGWGGFWAWDPVENASLLPWLGATALLHAAMVDEHRMQVRSSTVALALGVFVAALVGTTLTRSGAVSSVHAFAEAVAVGRALLALVVVVVVGSAVLVWRHRHGCALRSTARGPGSSDLSKPDRASFELSAPVRAAPGFAAPAGWGRRQALGLNAVIVLGIALVVAWGTLFPLAAELAGRRSFVVDGRFFALLSAPLALAALGLVGVAPVLRWRRGCTPGGRRTLPLAGIAAAAALGAAVVSGLRTPFVLTTVLLASFSAVLLVAELVRRLRSPGPPRARRRAAGAVLAHLGVVVFLAGVAGSTTGQTATIVLAPGEQASVAGYALRHDGVAVGPVPAASVEPVPPASGSRSGGIPTPSSDQSAAGARIIVLDLALIRGNDLVATLHPEQAVFERRGLVLAETALRSTPIDDVLVAIRRVGDDGTAVLEVSVRPLAVWVWWGWIAVAVGGALASIGRRPATTRDGRPTATDRARTAPASASRSAAPAVSAPPAFAPGAGPPWRVVPAPGSPVPTRSRAAPGPAGAAPQDSKQAPAVPLPAPGGPAEPATAAGAIPGPDPCLGAASPPSPTGPAG